MMISKHINDRGKGLPKGELPGPLDGMAAATAVGFAMAAQAMDMWFGIMSGVARASQDMLEPHLKAKAGEPSAFSHADKTASVKAKSAARTVVADMERTARDVVEVAVGLVGAEAPKETPQPGAVAATQSENVVPLKPVAKAAAPTAKRKPAADGKEAVTPAAKATAAKPKRAGPATASARPKTAAPVELKPSEPETATAAEPASKATVKSGPSARVTKRSAEAEIIAEPAAPNVQSDAAAVTADQPIMPEDFRQPTSMEKPEAPDDLKLVPGIGPKLEKVLNGLGVWTFGQVAAWAPEEIAWVDDYLGMSGRIARDGWVAQAANLTGIESAQ